MGIREQLVAAREAAGISQEDLAKSARWDRSHVSKFESGGRGASVEKMDAWLEACGAHLVAVPTAMGPEHMRQLPDDLRDLLTRLAAVLPHLDRGGLVTLRGLIQAWEEDQGAVDATTHDSRASAS